MELVNNRYKIIDCLEKDHYYSQYLVIDLLKRGKKVILCLVADNQITRPFIEYCNANFYQISSYRQENINQVYCYGIVETIDDRYIDETIFFYTTEYIDSISLEDIKNPLNEHQIFEIYKQLSNALDFLHYHGIVYKYMGTESIKLIKKNNNYTVKLLDLISIQRMEKMKAYFHFSTCSFLAPELGYDMKSDTRTDIYSLGALLYCLLNLKQLDYSDLNLQIEKYSKDNSLKFKLLKIIRKMTYIDIDMRYKTIHECNDAFRTAYNLQEPIENSKDVNKINFKTSITGRDREIKQILDLCETTEDKIRRFNKNLVLINGDKGIGKTRLLSEINKLIKWKKYKTFFMTISLQEEGFRRIIGGILKQFIKISSETIITKYGKELVKLVPELRSNRDIIPSQVLPKEQEELRLYDRVANFIIETSLLHPCVILIDEIHLADRSFIEFIDYLLNLNRIKKAPFLLILSYEDEQFYFDENINYVKKWSLDNTLNIKLSRLTVEETANMIKNILGWNKEPLSFASYIMRETEGIPGNIEEVIKELYSQRLLVVDYCKKDKSFGPTITVDSYDKISVSKTLDESIIKQIESLDNTTRSILDAISLFNTAISKDIIRYMLESKENDYDDYFSRLTELKILSEKFDDWGYTYGFHNKDFKKHIYNNLEPNRKTILHSRASNILEKLYIKEGRENKDELIYHLTQSNQIDKAIYYCIQSGITMLRLFVYEQAYTFFNQAYNLLEDDTDSRKLTVLLHLGEVSLKLSKNKDAINYFNYALKLASLQNKPNKLVDAKNKIGFIYVIRNKFELAERYLIQSLDNAKKIDYANGIMEAAYLLNRLYMQIREIEKIENISVEYFDYALKQNDLYYMGMFLGQKGIVEYFKENIASALDIFKKSVEYLEKANKIEETSRPINNIGVIYQNHFQDSYNARLYFDKALKVCQQYHKIDGIITYSSNIAECYVSEHENYKAIDILRENLELALEYEDEISILLVYNNLIEAYTNIGEYKQAYTYLLKAKAIYDNKKFNNKGIYLETYLEASAKLYMAMGVYNEALKVINEFFEKFTHVEYSICLRMKQLHYFAKYYSGAPVRCEDLMELIKAYRETTYVRDRRMILLEGASYFIENLKTSEAKLLLEEDNELISKINSDYFILKRKHIESFVLSNSKRIEVLEDLLLSTKIDVLKEIHWDIHANLGDLYLKSNAYFRAINSYLNALDIIYALFNSTPKEFRKSYLLKNNKFLIRANLFEIKELIDNKKLNGSLYINQNNPKLYKDRLVSENNLDYFFDVFEIQSILENEKFYELTLQYYDRVNRTNINNIEGLIASFTDNSINNLKLLLQLACRITLASKGAIIIDKDGYEIVATVGNGICRDKINNILESVTSFNKEIFIKSSLNSIRDLNREYFGKDTRALICMPIYKEKHEELNMVDDNRKNINRLQKKIIGYLYLETDKIFNNFSEETLSICRSFIPLAGILLNNHYLTIFSSIDKMTGTYVRKYFEQLFDEEIQHTQTINQPLSVIMLDIDHFKSVNDTFGHQKGDAILTEVGKIIRGNVRSTDYVGRYGGEEFIVLLPSADKDDALNIAEKIRKKVQNSNLLGNDVQLTISCGTATFPYDGNSQEQIIEKADQALYIAKESGRNQSVMWKKDIGLKNKRVDKLAGIVTGNIVQDQRNVLVITEIIELISSDSTIENKVFTILGRLIEILEADEGILFHVENNIIIKKYFRRRFVEDWVDPFKYNKNLINSIIETMQGKYMIDWENITDFDSLSNTPNWKSVILVPVMVNKKVSGVIYLSVPIKEKEFDYSAYNLVEITSNVIGAILKTSK